MSYLSLYVCLDSLDSLLVCAFFVYLFACFLFLFAGTICVFLAFERLSTGGSVAPGQDCGQE